jgi:hypothetical protein
MVVYNIFSMTFNLSVFKDILSTLGKKKVRV